MTLGILIWDANVELCIALYMGLGNVAFAVLLTAEWLSS